MMPGKFDLKLYRGDSYAWQFKLWKDDARTDPVDLTDTTVAAQIRDKPGGSTIVSIPCSITMPNIVNITIDPILYDDMPSKGAWDFELTFPGGQVQTPIAGVVLVTADITRL